MKKIIAIVILLASILFFGRLIYINGTSQSAHVSGVKQNTKGSTASQDNSLSCKLGFTTDLASHMQKQIDDRIKKVSDYPGARSLWKTMSPTLEGAWERNPNVWTNNNAPLDFTGVSPFNSHPSNGYPYRQAGTLVSPRHMIMASHYSVQIGAKVVFVDNNNVSHVRTLVSSKSIPGTDIKVGLLDSDLPNTIVYYPVVDALSFVDRAYKVDNENPEFPIISLNKNDEVLSHAYTYIFHVKDINPLSNSGGVIALSHAPYFVPDSTTGPLEKARNTPERIKLSGHLVDGDSGHPNFMDIGGRLVFIGTHWGSGYTTFIGGYIKEVNAAMKELGGDYELNVLPLNCFKMYKLNHAPDFGLAGGLLKEIETPSNFDLDSGYYRLSENLPGDLTKPFISFRPSDKDEHKMNMSITMDSCDILSQGNDSYDVYLKRQPVFRGTKVWGVTTGDICEFSITLTDKAAFQASKLFSGGFIITPARNTDVIPPVIQTIPVTPVIPVIPAVVNVLPVAQIVSPTAGANLFRGAWYGIRWENVPQTSDTIDIYVVPSTGGEVKIASVPANQSLYQWTIPATFIPDANVRIKLYKNGSPLATSGTFSVSKAPSEEAANKTLNVSLSQTSLTKVNYTDNLQLQLSWTSSYPIARLWFQIIQNSSGSIQNAGFAGSYQTGVESGTKTVNVPASASPGTYTLKLCDVTTGGVSASSVCGERQFAIVR